MNKVVQTFITVEKSMQILVVIGVILFLGYTVLTSYQSNNQEFLPVTSPTIQK